MANKTNLKNISLIVGSGRFGAALANKYSSMGKNVVIVDKMKDSLERLSDNFSGFSYVGDAADIAVLEKCHIDKAKEIIITTGEDNVNLLVAHIARKIFDVPDIYVRLNAPDDEQLIKGLKIKPIFPLELSIDEFNRLKGDQK